MTIRRLASPLALLALAVLTGITVRIVVLLSSIGRLDGDEGVTGVMAQGILDGHFPAFFGNQNYQGALEQYLQAGVLALLPDTPFTLRLVQVGLMAAAIILTYLLAREVTGSPWGGVVAAWLMAVGPYYLVVKGVKSHGGYDGAMVAGLVMILLALALRRSTARAPLIALGIGLTGGIALWENPTALYLVIPAAVWALGSARGSLTRLLPLGLLGAVVGLLPWIVHSISTGAVAPSRSQLQPETTALDRLRGLLDPVLPDFLGVANSNPAIDPGLPATAVTVALLALLAIGIYLRRRGLVALVLLRTQVREPIDLIILALVLTPVLYTASTFTWLTSEPRYLFTVYPMVAVAIAAGILGLPSTTTRLATTLGTLIATAFVLGVSVDAATRAGGTLSTARTGAFPNQDLPLVVEALNARGATTAYGNYWLAGPLQFASGNNIEVAAGLWTQFPETEQRVRTSRSPAVIVPTEPGAQQVERLLLRTKRAFSRAEAGGFTVFTDIMPPWHPAPASFIHFPT